MSIWSGGQVSGPGGSLAWQLRGPALLAQAAALRRELQNALLSTAQRMGQSLRDQAKTAYAQYTSIADGFGFQVQASPYVALTMFNTNEIFRYVELKTEPHVIHAKNGPYLWFHGSKGWARVALVHHPGTKGKYLVAPLFAQAAARFQAAIQAAATEVLSRG